MVELEEDLDSFFGDESVLSAVAAAENQHMTRRFSNYGACGEDLAGKRNEQREERVNSYSNESHQGDFSNTDGFSENKRRRTVDDRDYSRPTNFKEQESGVFFDNKPEGDYMAALRGSNSEMWQRTTREKGSAGNSSRGGASGYAGNASGSSGGRGGASETCYKCGYAGHWARDCTKPNGAGSFSAQSGGPLPQQADVPERNCPCGAGACIVLTANTEKNAGRRFYKCPLKRDEGQCTFFDWCDVGGGGQSFQTDRTPTLDIPQIECKCGGGACVKLTAKTERNNGRAFYKCPLPKDQACGFFQWCDGAGDDSSMGSTAISNRSFSSSESPASRPCYKCGLGGHWAKDCTMQSSGGFGNDSSKPRTAVPSRSFGSSESPAAGACYKCGIGGHWAKDCTMQSSGGFGNDSSNPRAAVPNRSFGSSEGPVAGACYKCGKGGHWAKDCTMKSTGGFENSNSYKPGTQRNYGKIPSR